MGGLQFCECPPKLVFESVDGFGSDDARDPRYHIFLGNEHFVGSALVDLLAILCQRFW